MISDDTLRNVFAKAVPSLLVLTMSTTGVIRAQDSTAWPRADRLTVVVGARLLPGSDDSVRFEYTVANGPSSEQAGWAFVVRTFVPVYRLETPTFWLASAGLVQDSAAAHWYAVDRSTFIQAGTSRVGFRFSAVGLPEPVEYRVEGYYDLPVGGELDPDVAPPRPPSFWANSVPGFTVGIIPFPPDSTPGFLIGRLRALTDRACDLSWLTATQCSSLRGKLDLAQQALGQGDVAGARGQVEAFRNDVNAFTGDAFALLKPNAEYVLRVLPGGTPPSVTTVYFHGSGGTANPPTLSLSTAAPTASTAKTQDSPAIAFSGGNPWVAVGTWTAPLGVSTPPHVGDVQAWFGLKNSDDIGTKFDIRVEVLRNGTLAGAGQVLCRSGLTNAPASATSTLLNFSPSGSGSGNGPNDVLALRVLTRIGTTTTGAFCGGHNSATGLRLYFDATSRAARMHWQVTQPGQ